MTYKELRKRVAKIYDVGDSMISDGTWNYDKYSLGMANCMILVQSILEDRNIEPFEAPETWGSEKNAKKAKSVKVNSKANNKTF